MNNLIIIYIDSPISEVNVTANVKWSQKEQRAFDSILVIEKPGSDESIPNNKQ